MKTKLLYILPSKFKPGNIIVSSYSMMEVVRFVTDSVLYKTYEVIEYVGHFDETISEKTRTYNFDKTRHYFVIEE